MEITMTNTETPVTKVPTGIAKGLDAKSSPNTVKAAKASKAKAPAKAKAETPKAKAKAKSPAQRKGDAPANRTSAVADYCRSIGIEPALGRAKLRRNGLSAPYTDMKKVRSILKGE